MPSTTITINDFQASKRNFFKQPTVLKLIEKRSGCSVELLGSYIAPGIRNDSSKIPLKLRIIAETETNLRKAEVEIDQILSDDTLKILPNIANRIYLGMENVPEEFSVKYRLLGTYNENVRYVYEQTGENISVRGRGSEFVGVDKGAREPPHIYIEYGNPEMIDRTRGLIINLIETVQRDFNNKYNNYYTTPPTFAEVETVNEEIEYKGAKTSETEEFITERATIGVDQIPKNFFDRIFGERHVNVKHLERATNARLMPYVEGRRTDLMIRAFYTRFDVNTSINELHRSIPVPFLRKKELYEDLHLMDFAKNFIINLIESVHRDLILSFENKIVLKKPKFVTVKAVRRVSTKPNLILKELEEISIALRSYRFLDSSSVNQLGHPDQAYLTAEEPMKRTHVQQETDQFRFKCATEKLVPTVTKNDKNKRINIAPPKEKLLVVVPNKNQKSGPTRSIFKGKTVDSVLGHSDDRISTLVPKNVLAESANLTDEIIVDCSLGLSENSISSTDQKNRLTEQEKFIAGMIVDCSEKHVSSTVYKNLSTKPATSNSNDSSTGNTKMVVKTAKANLSPHQITSADYDASKSIPSSELLMSKMDHSICKTVTPTTITSVETRSKEDVISDQETNTTSEIPVKKARWIGTTDARHVDFSKSKNLSEENHSSSLHKEEINQHDSSINLSCLESKEKDQYHDVPPSLSLESESLRSIQSEKLIKSSDISLRSNFRDRSIHRNKGNREDLIEESFYAKNREEDHILSPLCGFKSKPYHAKSIELRERSFPKEASWYRDLHEKYFRTKDNETEFCLDKSTTTSSPLEIMSKKFKTSNSSIPVDVKAPETDENKRDGIPFCGPFSESRKNMTENYNNFLDDDDGEEFAIESLHPKDFQNKSVAIVESDQLMQSKDAAVQTDDSLWQWQVKNLQCVCGRYRHILTGVRSTETQTSVSLFRE